MAMQNHLFFHSALPLHISTWIPIFILVDKGWSNLMLSVLCEVSAGVLG